MEGCVKTCIPRFSGIARPGPTTCLIVGYLPQWMSLKVDILDVYFMDEQTTSKTLDISLHTGTSPACVAQRMLNGLKYFVSRSVYR